MTIYSSLTAGVAGLLTNAHRLGSISDNIANSSTQVYKRADTDFHSLVNKGLGGEYSAGGVRATTQRLVGENGAYTNTKNATDIAVRGRGLLPVTTRSAVTQGDHTDNLLLTTTGSFRTDSEGYLTSTSGLVLMGWKAKADGTMPVYPRDTTQGLEPIKINRNQFLHNPKTKITFSANLPATGTEVGADGSVEKSSLEYFDNLGKSQALNIEFTPKVPASGDASNAWTMMIKDSAQTALGPTSTPRSSTSKVFQMGAQIATLPAMTAEGQMLFQWGETMGDARLSGELSTEVRISAGPSAKSAIPHAAVPAQITRQIAEHIPAAIGKPVQITLQPEELGRVRLSVAVSETGVILSILAERGETLDLMRRNIDQLQQDFQTLGFGTADFLFQSEGDLSDAESNPDQDADTEGSELLSDNGATIVIQAEGLDMRI